MHKKVIPKINFNGKKTNFFAIATLVKQNNLDHANVMEQAFNQNVFIDENKNLLENFINSIKYNKIIKSQLYQENILPDAICTKFPDIWI